MFTVLEKKFIDSTPLSSSMFYTFCVTVQYTKIYTSQLRNIHIYYKVLLHVSVIHLGHLQKTSNSIDMYSLHGNVS